MKEIQRLEEKILRGYQITKKEALEVTSKDIELLRTAANNIRKHMCGNGFELCSIISGKSGKCPEDCKYCAQSAHYKTNADFYELLSKETFQMAAKKNYTGGAKRFSIVTSGKRLTDREVEKLCEIYSEIGKACEVSLCASHGLLSKEQFIMLKQTGVERYHNNLETSRNYFPKVCTTHSYDDKIAAVKDAQEAGLSVCSGGIIGMGESMEDRIDMALTLRELQIQSIPLNILNPIPGTPFENMQVLPEIEAERTAAIFRFILPTTQIRLAGGRIHLKDKGKRMIESGVNAAISGDMLTTQGTTMESDCEMIAECGFDLELS